MAGHVRTTDTGSARRTSGGRARRVREHLPAGQSETARRRKAHLGARTVVLDQLRHSSDPLRRIDIARDYLRSAAAKFRPDESGTELESVVTALVAAADHLYAQGVARSESERRARRELAAQRRRAREQTRHLVREGVAAVRRQRAAAETAPAS